MSEGFASADVEYDDLTFALLAGEIKMVSAPNHATNRLAALIPDFGEAAPGVWPYCQDAATGQSHRIQLVECASPEVADSAIKR